MKKILAFLGVGAVALALVILFLVVLSAGTYIFEGAPYDSGVIDWARSIIQWPWYVHLLIGGLVTHAFYYFRKEGF